MFTGKRVQRLGLALELVVCLVLVGIVSLNALRRMDYFGENAQHIRMTDASRTALVAKNIAEGNGYATYDLPAALIDLYDQRGKLHDEHWVNADRFPFAAYATAALYKVTGSTSWRVGITGYNLLAFVGFLLLLYAAARSWFDDRYAGLAAVALALLHPYTFQFLYWKDGDMLLLTTAAMMFTYRYFALPRGTMSRLHAVGLGTSLAFLFLARPNLGAAFVAFLGISTLARLWTSIREQGLMPALKRHATREILVMVVFVLWCVPFVIHTMHEWGQPLFSANNLYQLPLGTRYGMGTDTWWKYSEPGHPVTLGLLASHDSSLLWSKFTSSWVATIRNLVGSYPIELALACGLVVTLARRNAQPRAAGSPQRRPLRMITLVIVFAFVLNLAILPLYSFQDYSFRHYLAFGLPLLWAAGGAAVVALARYLQPLLPQVRDHMRAHGRWYAAALVAALFAWNIGASSSIDGNRMFGRTAAAFETHWLAAVLLLLVVLARRWILRPPWLPRLALLAFTMVYACYRPSLPMKRTNFSWFPASEAVWDTMKQRTGLVSSFALQGEVAWNTGRKNIPAPEWPMHIYSFLFDHQLEVEDLYIESAAALISNVDGPFGGAAPGFEGYARLQEYRTMPGYEVAYHGATVRGYPKFRVKPRYKASTVFHLVDRTAVQALRKSPEKLVLGDPSNVIYTAHGWERYFTLDDKPVVMATNITRRRYPTGAVEAPYEDASITFFVDDRIPTSVELEVYAPQAATYQFYWDLDLYEYDRPADRKQHAIGTLATTQPGWQTVKLEIPKALVRKGLNKLGFRTSAFRAVVLCPAAVSDAACLGASATDGSTNDKDASGSPLVVRPTGLSDMDFGVASLFVHAATFHY